MNGERAEQAFATAAVNVFLACLVIAAVTALALAVTR